METTQQYYINSRMKNEEHFENGDILYVCVCVCQCVSWYVAWSAQSVDIEVSVAAVWQGNRAPLETKFGPSTSVGGLSLDIRAWSLKHNRISSTDNLDGNQHQKA